MTPLARHLSAYADYHRDHRNIVTHLIGIPLIVLAIQTLLSRPVLAGAVPVTPAMLASVAAAWFYLRLDLRFGVAMAVLLALGCWAGLAIARADTAVWLGIGLGLFVIGWIIQFVGHWFEGRKPAFVDDIRGLIVGPLFVVAEVAFWLGLRRDVRRDMAAGQKAVSPTTFPAGT